MRFPIQRLFNRATWLKFHLYLALSVGFLFALMGLTAVSVFTAKNWMRCWTRNWLSKSRRVIINLWIKLWHRCRQRIQTRYGSWRWKCPDLPTVWLRLVRKPTETYFELYAHWWCCKSLHSRGCYQSLLGTNSDHLAAMICKPSFSLIASAGMRGIWDYCSWFCWLWLYFVVASISGDLQGFTRACLLTGLRHIHIPDDRRTCSRQVFGIHTTLAIKASAWCRMMQLVFDVHRIIGFALVTCSLLLAFTGLSFEVILRCWKPWSVHPAWQRETGPNIN